MANLVYDWVLLNKFQHLFLTHLPKAIRNAVWKAILHIPIFKIQELCLLSVWFIKGTRIILHADKTLLIYNSTIRNNMAVEIISYRHFIGDLLFFLCSSKYINQPQCDHNSLHLLFEFLFLVQVRSQ